MQDETQKRVFEALNNKTWGASSTILMEIAKETYSYEKFPKIFKIVWEALESASRSWRKIFKSLMLCEYLVKNGCERCVDEIRDHTYKIRQLQDFQYHEERVDRGQGVREKAKQLLELLSDNGTIRDAREQAKRLKDKFVGVGSTGGTRGGGDSYGGSYSDGGGGGSSGGGGGYGGSSSSQTTSSSYGGSYSDGGSGGGFSSSSGGGGGYGGGGVGGRYSEENAGPSFSDHAPGRYDSEQSQGNPIGGYGGSRDPADDAGPEPIVPAIKVQIKPKAKAVPRLKLKTETQPPRRFGDDDDDLGAGSSSTDLFPPREGEIDEPSTDLFPESNANDAFDPRGGSAGGDEFADFSQAAPEEVAFQPDLAATDVLPPAADDPFAAGPSSGGGFADFAAAAPPPPLAETDAGGFDAFAAQPPLQPAAPVMQTMPQQQQMMPQQQQMMPQQMAQNPYAQPTNPYAQQQQPPPRGVFPGYGQQPGYAPTMGGGVMGGGPMSGGPPQAQPQRQEEDFGDFDSSPGPEPPKKDIASSIINLDSLSLNTKTKAKNASAAPSAAAASSSKANYAQHAAFTGLDGFNTTPQNTMMGAGSYQPGNYAASQPMRAQQVPMQPAMQPPPPQQQQWAMYQQQQQPGMMPQQYAYQQQQPQQQQMPPTNPYAQGGGMPGAW